MTTYTFIGKQIVSTALSSITLGGISTSFNHLVVVWHARTGATSGNYPVSIRLNSDGSSYSYNFYRGVGGGRQEAANNNQPYGRYIGYINNARESGGILNLTESNDTGKHKNWTAQGGGYSNTATSGNGAVVMNSGRWGNTAAVNSITFYCDDGSQSINSGAFYVYGLS
jgi:hypothetical protein